MPLSALARGLEAHYGRLLLINRSQFRRWVVSSFCPRAGELESRRRHANLSSDAVALRFRFLFGRLYALYTC